MSVLTTKFNEDEMLNMLGELLYAGESITAALYCIYKDTGFFASNRNVIPGYVALTDRNRLIGYKMNVLGTNPVSLDLEFLKKIKITDWILGNKIIYLCTDDGRKNEVKFQYVQKVIGSQAKFPNQERNSEILLDTLRAMESRL